MAVPIIRQDADLAAIDNAEFDAVIDVRSPAEFVEDHMPNAINLPVLDDQQRAEIGTLYKQVGSFEAKRAGAALVAKNIATHLESALAMMPRTWRPLVYCWRGGQRSGAMARIFSDIGWHVAVIEGGYKAYRRSVLTILDDQPGKFDLTLISGKTGTAKTKILRAAAQTGLQVIDLEGLANHRGSLLGREPDMPQPSQRLFESRLAAVMRKLDPKRPVFVEAESNRVGQIHVPPALWKQMHRARRITIDAPLEARIDFLIRDYHHITTDRQSLRQLLSRLGKRHSAERLAQWDRQILDGDWPGLVKGLIEQHYDPSYKHSTAARGGHTQLKLTTDRLDEKAIAALVRQIDRLHPAS